MHDLNRTQKTFKLFTFVVLMMLSSACATQQSKTQDYGIQIDTVNSSTAQITISHLKTKNGTLVLYGKVARIYPRRGSIPGHIHVELINADNKLISETRIQYKRKRVQSTYSNFHLVIPFALPQGSRLRIIHHGIDSRD